MKQIVTDLVSLVWCGAAAASSGCWLPPSGDGGFQGLFPSGEPLNTCRCLHKETCCPRGKKIGPSYPCSLPCGPINILALTNPVSSRSGRGGAPHCHVHTRVFTPSENAALIARAMAKASLAQVFAEWSHRLPPCSSVPLLSSVPPRVEEVWQVREQRLWGSPLNLPGWVISSVPKPKSKALVQQPAGVSVSGQQCCGRG